MILFLLLSSLTAFALETEFSGSGELQYRNSRNNPEADKYFQTWKKTEAKIFLGQVGVKVQHQHHSVESNLFVRYLETPLLRNPNNLAPKFYLFPQRMVVRDLFNLKASQTSSRERVEALPTKLFYQIELEKFRVEIGRVYLTYGQGEIFNPINPFNQPTALNASAQVAQGNDGGTLTYFASQKHDLHLSIFGDKSQGETQKTFWFRTNSRLSDQLSLMLVGGEDQKRKKAGAEVTYQGEEALYFSQIFYQKNALDQESFDFLLGLDQQLHSLWHLRVEAGHQKRFKKNVSSDTNRFLPTETFLSIGNQIEITPLLKQQVTFIYDLKSSFAYGVLKTVYEVRQDLEIEGFFLGPALKGGKASDPLQEIVTRDFGLALRGYF